MPFPYVPNTPGEYNLNRFDLQDTRVAMFTHEQYHEYYEGLASERVVCFDTGGHCVEYFYRDHDICQHRVFEYDSLGRRIEERAWEDTAGRLVCRTWPDASTERYEYNAEGELKAKINRDGTYEWYMATPPPMRSDSLGRVLEEVVGASQGNSAPIIATYSYDDHGNWVRRTTTGISSPTVLEVRTFRYYDE